MTTQSSAGTTVALSAGTPATWDAAGFGALTFTGIGKIKNAGEFGKTFQLITSEYLSQRGVEKRKGTFNAGTLDLQVDLNGDAGQALCETARDDDDDYSFEVTLQNGDTYYVRGLVVAFAVSVGGPNNMVSATIKIELNPIFAAGGAEVAAIKA